MPIIHPDDDQLKPLKINNINLKPSFKKFDALRKFYSDSEILSLYLNN